MTLTCDLSTVYFTSTTLITTKFKDGTTIRSSVMVHFVSGIMTPGGLDLVIKMLSLVRPAYQI